VGRVECSRILGTGPPGLVWSGLLWASTLTCHRLPLLLVTVCLAVAVELEVVSRLGGGGYDQRARWKDVQNFRFVDEQELVPSQMEWKQNWKGADSPPQGDPAQADKDADLALQHSMATALLIETPSFSSSGYDLSLYHDEGNWLSRCTPDLPGRAKVHTMRTPEHLGAEHKTCV